MNWSNSKLIQNYRNRPCWKVNILYIYFYWNVNLISSSVFIYILESFEYRYIIYILINIKKYCWARKDNIYFTWVIDDPRSDKLVINRFCFFFLIYIIFTRRFQNKTSIIYTDFSFYIISFSYSKLARMS